jgi:hypothetical protein
MALSLHDQRRRLYDTREAVRHNSSRARHHASPSPIMRHVTQHTRRAHEPPVSPAAARTTSLLCGSGSECLRPTHRDTRSQLCLSANTTHHRSFNAQPLHRNARPYQRPLNAT